ncbi:flagellar protein FlhE [Solwaraspora sp. WMMB762]|uniref:flagellar protein FlhE n=1 Tax=Solwaraspora sp. WMMB762 TaxID=3404120 RepID=UPI003B93C77D
MKALRRTLVAFSAIIAVMLPANAAEAAVSNYMRNPIGGVLYQTNWWYTSSTVSGTAPTGALITTVHWSYSLSNHSGVEAYLCIPVGCSKLTGASGVTTAFVGQPASQSWTFYFQVPASTTHLLSPPRTGGAHMVDVTYVY